MVWQVIGGISGALSIAAGAYGAHGLKDPPTPKQDDPSKRPSPPPTVIWSRAVHYHQLHSLVLVALPYVTKPGSKLQPLAGALFSAGIVLFSGGCYAYALTQDKRASKVAPCGGTSFILAWLVLAAAGSRMRLTAK